MSATGVLGYRFAALGCSARIRIAGVDAASADAFVAEAAGWLRGIEARLTRFRDDSMVGRINALAGRGGVRPDGDLDAALEAAELAWRTTDGRIDATSLPLTRCWSDPARTTWPSDGEIAAALSLVGWPELRRDRDLAALPRAGMGLDLGGVGKEWAVDRLIERARAAGIADCLVELGGDCAARGAQPGRDGWLIALPGGGALPLRDAALATSGIGTRRRTIAGREVPHLVDARSGLPAGGALRSVTVLAASCLDAGIRASDACLLERADPAAVVARCAGLPMWCLTADGRLLADPRLASRVHPIVAQELAA